MSARVLADVLLAGLALSASADDKTTIADLVNIGQGLKRALDSQPPPSGMEIQRRGFGVIDDASLNAALQEVLAEVVAQAPAEAPPARIWATPDPAFRAYTSPDATIFLAYGLLQSVQTRDELVALVAHEYAHVALGHIKPEKAGEFARAASGVTSLYFDHRYGGAPELEEIGDIRPYLAYGLAMESIQTGAMPAWRRKQESAADLFAADLLVAAGYNPVAMIDLLSRMGAWEKVQEERYRASQVQMLDFESAAAEQAKQGNVENAAMAVVVGGLHNLMASASNAMDRGVRKAKRQHATAAKRHKAMLGYLRLRHRDAARPEPRALPWAGDARIAAIFDGIDKSHAFVALIEGEEDGRTIAARHRELRESAAADVAYTRYVLQLAFNVAVGRRESVKAMTHELQRGDSLFSMHMLVLDLLAQVGSPDEQRQALEASRAALGDPPELLPHSVRVYRRGNVPQRAAQALQECLGYGDPVLEASCRKEAS